MPPACTFTRGEFVFTVRLRDGAESVRITHNGRALASGRFERFTAAYLASRRYQAAFSRVASKPVGRVGDVFIGPDAAAALTQAIEARRAQLPAREALVRRR